MDKLKIGKFISICRKERQITQEQLAERLGVTNKSVSKWETGSCLPDPTLYEPLCAALGITVGELFSGELCCADTQDLAQDQLLGMLKRKMYEMSDRKVSFEAFDRALGSISEVALILKEFPTKEAAVAFLAEETDCGPDRCAAAYDFYTGLFDSGKLSEVL